MTIAEQEAIPVPPARIAIRKAQKTRPQSVPDWSLTQQHTSEPPNMQHISRTAQLDSIWMMRTMRHGIRPSPLSQHNHTHIHTHLVHTLACVQSTSCSTPSPPSLCCLWCGWLGMPAGDRGDDGQKTHTYSDTWANAYLCIQTSLHECQCVTWMSWVCFLHYISSQCADRVDWQCVWTRTWTFMKTINNMNITMNMSACLIPCVCAVYQCSLMLMLVVMCGCDVMWCDAEIEVVSIWMSRETAWMSARHQHEFIQHEWRRLKHIQKVMLIYHSVWWCVIVRTLVYAVTRTPESFLCDAIWALRIVRGGIPLTYPIYIWQLYSTMY